MTLEFGTDGIRGVANRELTPELVTALGRACARVIGTEHPFVVGRDTRRSGPMLEAALIAGLCCRRRRSRAGRGAADAGRRGARRRLAAHPGSMISASHNPYEDNGVKLFAPGGHKITDELEQRVEYELRELAAAAARGRDRADPAWASTAR